MYKKFLQKGGNIYNIKILANYNHNLINFFEGKIECDDTYTLNDFFDINMPKEYKNKFILYIRNTQTPYNKYALNTSFNEIERTSNNKIKLYIKFSDTIELLFKALTDSQKIILDYYDYMTLSFEGIKKTKLKPLFNNKYNFFMYNNKICLPHITVSLLEITDFNVRIEIHTLVIINPIKKSIIDRLIDNNYNDTVRTQLDLYCNVNCADRVSLYWYYVLSIRPELIVKYLDNIHTLEGLVTNYKRYMDEYRLVIDADIANGIGDIQNRTVLYNRYRESYLSYQHKLDMFVKYYNELLLLALNNHDLPHLPHTDLIITLHSYFPDKVIYYLKQFLFTKNEYLLCITPKYFDLNKFKIFDSIEEYDDFIIKILMSEKNNIPTRIKHSIYQEIYYPTVKFLKKNKYSEYILDDFQNRHSDFIRDYLIENPSFMRYLSTSNIHALKDIIIQFLSERENDYLMFVPYKFGKYYPEELKSIIEKKLYKVRESDDSIIVNFIKNHFEDFSEDYQRMQIQTSYSFLQYTSDELKEELKDQYHERDPYDY
jgi:hypothetical protein